MLWSMAEKAQLFVSIGSSFVSIGYAFSTLDRVQGGQILAKLPGYCASCDARYFAVFSFRVAEVTSRATSLALFQAIAHPYGILYIVAADAVLITMLSMIFQYRVSSSAPSSRWSFVKQNLFFVVPSVLCCLMAPMLEKDCVLTMPPSVYYSLRVLELGAMVGVAGRQLDWDIKTVKAAFEDDGLVVAAFVASTLLMIILGLIIRLFLVVRVLLDAPGEIWTADNFNLVQHALRNRILMNHKGDAHEQSWIQEALRKAPNSSSGECQRLALKERAFAESPQAEWESKFLRAKVSLLLEQCVTGLDIFLGSSGALSDEPQAKWNLKTGSLVTIRSQGGTLNCEGHEITAQRSSELADQKFVIETTSNPFTRQPLLSGDVVCLRSLSSGNLLGVEPVSTEGAATFGVLSKADWPAAEASQFRTVLVHEATFTNARRFAEKVLMADKQSLDVYELRAPKLKGQKALVWKTEGWKIIAINGKVATRQDVDDILQVTQKSGRNPLQRGESFQSRAESEKGSVGTNTEVAGMPIDPGAAAAAKGEYHVWFRKIQEGSPIKTGDKVMLYHSGGWTRTPIGMSQGFASAHDDGVPEPPRPRIVDGEIGIAFTLEEADYGSKDDPFIYQWAADLINQLQDRVASQASFAEKYRALTVVAYNARTSGVDGVAGILRADACLHLSLLNSLLKPIRNEKDLRIQYDSIDEATDELELDLGGDDGRAFSNGIVKVVAFTEEDCMAAAAGIRPGDELLHLEIFGEEDIVNIITRPSAIREKLSDLECEDGVAFVFRCQASKAVDNQVVKKAVDQAAIIATLLPSWDEISPGQDGGGKSSLEDDLLYGTGFFLTRCALVETLLTAGWELTHDDFTDEALTLHQHLQAAPKAELEKRFPGKENQHLREEVLIAQLEVLVSAWRYTPRIIKEDRAKVLRSLFRPDVELAAMQDGLNVLYERWWDLTKQSGNNDLNIEMPARLVSFFEEVQPQDDEGTRGGERSVHWISKAWLGQKEQLKAVKRILSDFDDKFQQAETFWNNRVQGAEKKLEDAQSALKSAVDADEVKVVLASSKEDLAFVKGMLTSDGLVLKEDFQIRDSAVVPKGHSLVCSQGAVADHFKTTKLPTIHAKLTEMYKGGELRLLFSSGGYGVQQEDATKAIKELEKLMDMAKTAGQAFPNSVKLVLDSLSERLYKGQLQVRDQEAKRNLRVQEQELQETMRVANNRLTAVEMKKNKVEEQNKMLQQEKVTLQLDKQGVEDELLTVMDLK
ncbi:unnamed protein product, partial [Polarella glacialis]